MTTIVVLSDQVIALSFTVALALLAGCAGAHIGRPLPVDPRETLKVGHHRKSDAVRELGQPYRVSTDSRGRELLTYVWADGAGEGNKCIIALNENEVIYLVECMP